MALETRGDHALFELLQALQARGYDFVTPTPTTHARVLKHPGKQRARNLRDVFGWSLPFAPGDLDPEILDLLKSADALERSGALFKSRYRVSSLHGRLFLHSAYPTNASDSVFFGPDSYRFADLVVSELPPGAPGAVIVDIGAGAGVGALTAALRQPDARLVLTDVNPKALRLARINAEAAGVTIETVETGGLDGVAAPIDVALTNPPYIADDGSREYSDGGDMHGDRVSLEMAKAAAGRLVPGGRLILYTGSAIVDGQDRFYGALEQAMAAAGCTLSYREIDPDVFGEELDKPAYADVDRIAVVGAVAVKRG